MIGEERLTETMLYEVKMRDESQRDRAVYIAIGMHF
jgi:hypothetical protein